jgi:hypothetical protein
LKDMSTVGRECSWLRGQSGYKYRGIKRQLWAATQDAGAGGRQDRQREIQPHGFCSHAGNLVFTQRLESG